EPLGAWLPLPIMLNACCLLFCATLYNNLTAARYPKQAPRIDPHRTQDLLPEQRGGFTEEDLDRALDRIGSFIGRARDERERTIRVADSSALRRRSGSRRAERRLPRDLRTVGPDATVRQAIGMFRHHQVKALPVVDGAGRVQGIIGLSDLLAQLV